MGIAPGRVNPVRPALPTAAAAECGSAPAPRHSERPGQGALVFLRCRGNIREVEKQLGISYPTVCKRLDLVNELLGNRQPTPSRFEILERLERGEITAKEAAELLKGR